MYKDHWRTISFFFFCLFCFVLVPFCCCCFIHLFIYLTRKSVKQIYSTFLLHWQTKGLKTSDIFQSRVVCCNTHFSQYSGASSEKPSDHWGYERWERRPLNSRTFSSNLYRIFCHLCSLKCLYLYSRECPSRELLHVDLDSSEIIVLPYRLVRESKRVVDSGFHALDSGFSIPGTGFWILCQWNLDSGF